MITRTTTLSARDKGSLTERDETSEGALLKLAGALLLGGFLFYFVVTRFHPAGDENNHPVIFSKYEESDPWVIVHVGQFIGLLLALAGFVVLYRVLQRRGAVPLLARLALATTVATTAVWAVLQAVDGVALKEAVEAWASADGSIRSARFADAEIVRWIEWGLQSYFRLLFGLTFILFGIAIVRTGIVFRRVGWVAVLAGLLYISVGIAVGHTGFEQPGGLLIQLLFLIFMIGVLAAGVRGNGARETAAS